jgi:cell filamentation protein
MSEYAYNYHGTENYCYPGTDILRNKQGITDEIILTNAEREITSLRLLMIRDMQTMGQFDLAHLCNIHRFIFSDIYDWAGELRRGEFLSKGNSLFCRGPYLEENAKNTFSKLLQENYLRNLEKEQCIEQLAFYMGEVNALHPFREGNGRTAREFFRQLSLNAGSILDFGSVDKEALLAADIKAFNGQYDSLAAILNKTVWRTRGQNA